MIVFGLILARIAGLLAALPALSVEVAPVRVRAIAAFAMAVAFAAGAVDSPAADVPLLAFVAEFALGAALGFVVRVALAAVELAGELAGMPMGFGFGRLVDPLSGRQTGPITQLVGLMAGAILFCTGGYREVLRGLGGSLRVLPPGTVALDAIPTATLVASVGGMFESGLRIAAPLIFTAMATQAAFGLLGRVAPQLNLWALGFLCTIGVGLICLAIYMPGLVEHTRRMLDTGLAQLVQVAVG